MRNKRAPIVLGCVGLLLGLGAFAYRDLALRGRGIQNEMILRSLSTGVEMYRGSYEVDPSSLFQMSSNKFGDERTTEWVRQTLVLAHSNVWNDVYSYGPLSNGFRLTITGPDVPPLGWFGRLRRVERDYLPGQAMQPQ